MKIYRCVIGCLLVFFIAVGVWYVVSCYNEQRSMDDGTLIWEYEKGKNGNVWKEFYVRGEEEIVTSHSLC